MAYPSEDDVRAGVVFGASDELTGNMVLPVASDVRDTIGYGTSGTELTGDVVIPSINDVRSGVTFNSASGDTGNITLPSVDDVLDTVGYGSLGTEFIGVFICGLPIAGDVRDGVTFGPTGGFTGTLVLPDQDFVLSGTGFGTAGTEFMGTIALPSPDDVRFGVSVGLGGATGTLTLPIVGKVYVGITYGADGTEFTGTLALPAIGNVLEAIGYGAAGTEFTGTLVIPLPFDVRDTVIYGVGGTGSEGTITLPDIINVLSGIAYGGDGNEFTGILVIETISEEALSLPLSDVLNATTSTLYEHTFIATAIELPAGWTFATFIVKENGRTDSDDNALLIVRISNPAAAGTDGLLQRSGIAVDPASALRGKASLTMVSLTPDATIKVTLDSDALYIAPSLENDPYDYELIVWNAAGEKIVFASNGFNANRCLRREIVAP